MKFLNELEVFLFQAKLNLKILEALYDSNPGLKESAIWGAWNRYRDRHAFGWELTSRTAMNMKKNRLISLDWSKCAGLVISCFRDPDVFTPDTSGFPIMNVFDNALQSLGTYEGKTAQEYFSYRAQMWDLISSTHEAQINKT